MLKEIFKNCLYVDKINGKYIPIRFTTRQMAAYESEEAYLIRANSCSGVSMEFITDKDELSFEYDADCFCRQKLLFDIYENDVLIETVTITEQLRNGKIVYKRKHTSLESKIAFYLPYTARLFIYNIDIGNYKTVSDEGKPLYLAIGDSITQGIESTGASIAYPTLVARHFDAILLNQGVGGYKYLKESLDESFHYKPDFVSIAYGTNDFSQIDDINVIKKNIIDYYKKLEGMFLCPINVITPIWRSEIYEDYTKSLKFLRVAEIISNEASKYNYNIIDGRKLIPHNKEYYFDGNLHPNAKGFLYYTLNLLKYIKTK